MPSRIVLQPLVLLTLSLAMGACDRTPPAVRTLSSQRLPMLREQLAKIQKECTGMGPKRSTVDWGVLAADPQILNAKVACKTVPGLAMAVELTPMRPEPPGSKSSPSYLIGRSEKKASFPPEEARVPSCLTTEAGAIDLCVRSGHPDEANFTELCVSFRPPS